MVKKFSQYHHSKSMISSLAWMAAKSISSARSASYMSSGCSRIALLIWFKFFNVSSKLIPVFSYKSLKNYLPFALASLCLFFAFVTAITSWAGDYGVFFCLFLTLSFPFCMGSSSLIVDGILSAMTFNEDYRLPWMIIFLAADTLPANVWFLVYPMALVLLFRPNI